MRPYTLRFTTPAALIVLLGAVVWLNAGSLTPPAGPVAPTMKTLTEVEPRTAISSTGTQITQPGSYYLTNNLTVAANGVGIIVNAADVTLDLNGFTIRGPGGSGSGISAGFDARNVTLRNGQITGMAIGVELRRNGAAINSRFERLTVSNCGSIGIASDSHATATHCMTSATGFSGFYLGNHCLVESCTASGDTSGTGIACGSSSIVRNCTAYGNATDGIAVGTFSTVTDCTVANNNGSGIQTSPGCIVTRCTAASNVGSGVNVGDGTLISGCTARFNSQDGIRVSTDCRAQENVCDNNASGAGIRALAGGNRIEGNSASDNSVGIVAAVAGNLTIRNSLSGNATNLSMAAGNVTGTLVTTEAAMNSAANANVNIAY